MNPQATLKLSLCTKYVTLIIACHILREWCHAFTVRWLRSVGPAAAAAALALSFAFQSSFIASLYIIFAGLLYFLIFAFFQHILLMQDASENAEISASPHPAGVVSLDSTTSGSSNYYKRRKIDTASQHPPSHEDETVSHKPTKMGRNRGNRLAALPGMPLDILFEVLSLSCRFETLIYMFWSKDIWTSLPLRSFKVVEDDQGLSAITS